MTFPDLERRLCDAADSANFYMGGLLREAAQRLRLLEKLNHEAATHVEAVICMRTGFTGDPPYVGWEGLGLALNEALDERDRFALALSAARAAGREEALQRAIEEIQDAAGYNDALARVRALACPEPVEKASGWQPIGPDYGRQSSKSMWGCTCGKMSDTPLQRCERSDCPIPAPPATEQREEGE